AFPNSADEYTRPVERLLKRRRAEVDAAWENLEEGWEANSERTATLKVRPRTYEENVVKLNVGGSNVTLFWHLLAETEGFEDSILGALLEGVWGKGRIPLDADGRILLDESPTCIKHIIAQTTLRSNGRAGSVGVGLPEGAARSAVAMDEAPCLIYTAHVMGLSGYVPTIPKYVKCCGGSTILEPFEMAPFGAKVREWVGNSTDEMTLIYRATRDGFDTESFESRCNEDSHTVSLVRVSSGKGNDDEDSVVGGYSVIPWGVGTGYRISEEMLVFMLKDGSATRKNPSKPIKWSPYPCFVGHEFTINHCGARVVGADLITWLDARGRRTLTTGRKVFNIEKDSPFLALNGKKVVEIEVYLCSMPAPPTTTAPSTTKPDGDALTDAEAHDIDSFGRSIASSLMEERVVLHRAVQEMEAAGARVSAAVGALETVYGPSVAAGEQDTVVELNVRGTRMTTLRSTLQACPLSALTTMFDAERWPATGKDKDENGRRLIDCDPTYFSKILDVLRMRKRASWRGKQEEEKEEKKEESSVVLPGGVLVEETDAEAFGTAVNMYFPGCESFIMDLVQSV
ncbi:unnamed protein product, partial [Laminaria digitata]